MTTSLSTINTEKTDYEKPLLFLGENRGLFDTIHKSYPDIWKLFKALKADDWDENEFNFSSCVNEFRTASPSIYNKMITTLAWQWEADSSVANSIAPVASHFVTSDELWATWVRVTDNEIVHSGTYSEIVRTSFEDPDEVLKEILSINESLKRLSTVDEILSDAKKVGLKYSSGLVENNQDTYNHAFMFVVALLYLERLQFIASFAVTFAMANAGMFVPIGKAVQRIAKDELESHSEIDKAVITHELKTQRGQVAYEQTKETLEHALNNIVLDECSWIDFLHEDGEELPGVTVSGLKAWVGYNANVVYQFMGYKPSQTVLDAVGGQLPEESPLPFMSDWLDMSVLQPSPQEEDIGNYRMSTVSRTDEGKVYDDDF